MSLENGDYLEPFGADIPDSHSRSPQGLHGHGSTTEAEALLKLRSISMVDVLDQDPRPAFIVDLFAHEGNTSPHFQLRPIFCNKAFREQSGLLDVVSGKLPPDAYGQASINTYAAFVRWALETRVGEDVPRAFAYHGMSWTSATINSRWNMVNAILERQRGVSTGAFKQASWGPKAVPLVEARDEEMSTSDGSGDINAQADRQSSTAKFLQQALGVLASKRTSYDWTASTPPLNASEHILLARRINWASTPLGSMESWSSCLRHTVNLLMATPNPAVVLWGPDYTVIYNEFYPPLVGDKHPGLLGTPARIGFTEAWARFEPFVERCKEVGHGATFEDMQFFIDRGFGKQEETYFSISLAPIVDRGHGVVGFFEVVTETTKRKIGERRMATILEFGERTSRAQNLHAFWDQLSSTFKTNAQDISFSAIYSVNQDIELANNIANSDTPKACAKRLRLERATGVPKDHPSVPSDMEGSNLRGFACHFAEAFRIAEPLYLSVDEDNLDIALLEGLYSKGFQDPCRAIVVLPIFPTTGYAAKSDTVVSVIILGLNTRRAFDEEYQSFIRVLRRQITTSMASVLLLEEEKRRGRTIAEQAAIDQQEMEQKLSVRTAELEKRNLQFKHFVDAVPVGIFVLDFNAEYPKGKYAFRNDKWWQLVAGSKEEEESLVPPTSPLWSRIHKDDVETVRKHWTTLLSTKSSATFSFRMPRTVGGSAEVDAVWVLAYAFSVIDEDGTLRSVIGSLTDISDQKRIEDLHKQRLHDAMEAKRAQEAYIDVSSHEIRNPLSAIMISADDITSSLKALETCTWTDIQGRFGDVMRNCMDAAQVITDCAQHQRRIVDDILTISKLDSGLFSFTPAPTTPEVVINKLLKMFDPEFAAGRISRLLDIDPSFQILGIEQLMLDPSRLLQILINLVTNAIKFTKYAKTRKITIGLRASIVPPERTLHGHDYLNQRREREDLTETQEWGTEGIVYLAFSVSDTGRGLTTDEKELLFKRFSQTPKTHATYGGSGLGLFISRELAELQGGRIGVSSAGKDAGSDFSFYIKTRRAPATESLQTVSDTTDQQAAYAVRSALDHSKMEIDVLASPGMDLDTPPITPVTNTGMSQRKPKHALIVEDNLVNQRVLKKQLQKLGYLVSIANHGQEALDFLLTTSFAREPLRPNKSDFRQPGLGLDTSSAVINNMGATDIVPPAFSGTSTPGSIPPEITIVLMDSEMPVLDGLAAVRKIRSYEKEGVFVRRIPVIAITANVRLEQVNEALAAGMDDVVAKPFRVAELVGRIEKLTKQLDED